MNRFSMTLTALAVALLAPTAHAAEARGEILVGIAAALELRLAIETGGSGGTGCVA